MNIAVVEEGVIANVIVVPDGADPAAFGGVPLPEGKWIGDALELAPTTEERLASLEETKAEKTDVAAIAAAIEKGLSL